MHPITKNNVYILLTLIAASILSVIYQGFDFGIGNNVLQIPIIQRANDPRLYPHDLFVSTLDNYYSILWWLLAKIAPIEKLATIFLILHVAARILLLGAFYWLMRLLLSNTRLALVATAIIGLMPILFEASPVGRSDVFDAYFNHTEIGMAMLLMAYAALLSGRSRMGFVFLGVAFDMNAFVGVWGLVSMTLLQVSREKSPTVRELFIRYGLFGLIAAPVVFWILTSTDASLHVTFDYRDYLWQYYPYHFLIASADPRMVIVLLLAMVSGAMSLWLLRNHREEFGLLLFSHVLLFIAGILLPYLTANPTLLNLHMLRVDSFIVLIAVLTISAAVVQKVSARSIAGVSIYEIIPLLGLLLGNWIVVLIGLTILLKEEGALDALPRRLLVGALLISLAITLIFVGLPDFGHYRLLSIAWLIVSAVFMVQIKEKLAYPGLLAVIGAASYTNQAWLVALTILGTIPWVVLPFELSVRSKWRITMLVGGMCVVAATQLTEVVARVIILLPAILIAIGVAMGILRQRPQRSLLIPLAKKYGTLLAILLLLLPLAKTLLDRIERLTLSNLNDEAVAWRNVQLWAHRNTSVDEIFLVPLRQKGFSVFSERSVWVDWKQGAAVMWSKGFYDVWNQRLQEQSMQRTPEEVLGYARRHRIAYAVVEASHEISLSAEIAYKNPYFVVYRLDAYPRIPSS